MFKKIVVSIFLIVFTISILVMPVSAATTESYTRVDVPSGTETNISREMYYASKDITAASLGLDKTFEGITDIFCDDKGNIFLLCGDDSRIISIADGYESGKEIIV